MCLVFDAPVTTVPPLLFQLSGQSWITALVANHRRSVARDRSLQLTCFEATPK